MGLKGIQPAENRLTGKRARGEKVVAGKTTHCEGNMSKGKPTSGEKADIRFNLDFIAQYSKKTMSLKKS